LLTNDFPEHWHRLTKTEVDICQTYNLTAWQPNVVDTFTCQKMHNETHKLQIELEGRIVKHMPVVVITGV
jgi:hypothetical protein